MWVWVLVLMVAMFAVIGEVVSNRAECESQLGYATDAMMFEQISASPICQY